jgi:deoxyribonuclease V
VKGLDLHPWRVSSAEATAIQESLRDWVRIRPLDRWPRLVAGADVAYSGPTRRIYAAVVVVALPSLSPVETAEAIVPVRFPYLPGRFSFRELPPLLQALRRLRTEPDALLFDGQGLAHPRLFGLACHGGVLLGRPSVGCAKSRLAGEHGSVGRERGSSAELRVEGRVVGAALRTRDGVRPVYVSPGHLCDLHSAIDLVLATTPGFRVPEPIRLAHAAASQFAFAGRKTCTSSTIRVSKRRSRT